MKRAGNDGRTRIRAGIVAAILSAWFDPASAQTTATAPISRTQPEQAGNWLQAQIRHFRSYPHLFRAYRYLDQNKPREAADEIRTYLGIRPSDPSVRALYLHVLYGLHDTSELERQADLLLQLQPENPTALMYRGLVAQEKGHTAIAVASLRAVFMNETVPRKDREFAASAAAEAALSAGRYAEAIPALDVLSTIDTTFPVEFRRGHALAMLADLDGAERSCQAAAKLARNRDERLLAESALGYLAQKKGKYAEAILHGEAVLAGDPKNLDWIRTMANLYLKMGNYPMAERMARQAVDVTHDVKDRIYYANVLAVRHSYAAASEQYALAAGEAREPQMAYNANMGVGYAQQALGHPRQAQSAFARAALIESTPEVRRALASTVDQSDRAGTVAEADRLSALLEQYRREQTPFIAASIAYEYAQDDNHAQAAGYFERALKGRRNPEWQLALAEQYANLGDAGKASRGLATVLPRSESDWRRIGEIYLKLGDRERAVAALAKAGDAPEVLLQLGWQYVQMHQPDEALAVLQKLVRPDVQAELRAQALRQMGYIYAQTGDNGLGIAVFTAAIGLGDTDPSLRKALAHLLMKSERYEEALEQFLNVLEQERHAPNMLAVARTYAAMKQLEPALQYYRLADADAAGLGEADRAALHGEIASIYAELGRFVEARENWIQAAALNDTPDIQMSLVYVESSLGMTTEALVRLDALSRRGINGELHLAMLDQTALLHERSGNLAEATRYAALALATEPTAERHYHMALLASRAGNLQLARSHLESAVDMDPDNNDYRQQLAYVCNERGDTATAIRLFEEVADRDPTRTRLRQDIAYAYSRVADNGKAIEWFKKAIDEQLKARATRSSSQDQVHDLVADQETYALRQQVREMAGGFQFNAYQSYRPNVRQQTGNVTPGFVAGGIIPSQGGVELVYQPAGIGYRDGRTFRVFGRASWSNRPESSAIDPTTTQGGVGFVYKPLRNVNVYLSLERLFKIGAQAEGNWLGRASWGYSNGYDLRPHVRSWNQTILYADFGYFLQQNKVRSVYLEARQGRTINFYNTTLVTPHVTLVGRGQRPDPSRVSYLEAGAGVSVKYLFNETRYEAARSSCEFIAQYRKPVNNSKLPGGWVMTAVFRF